MFLLEILAAAFTSDGKYWHSAKEKQTLLHSYSYRQELLLQFRNYTLNACFVVLNTNLGTMQILQNVSKSKTLSWF